MGGGDEGWGMGGSVGSERMGGARGRMKGNSQSHGVFVCLFSC